MVKFRGPSCTTFLRQSLVTLCGGVKKGSSTRQKREKEIIWLVLDTPTIELFLHFDDPFERHNRMRFDHKVVEYGRP